MASTITIPDELAEKLEHRAAEHGRSIEEEVVVVLRAELTKGRPLTFAELHEKVKALGISTPSESAAMIREDRDHGHSV